MPTLLVPLGICVFLPNCQNERKGADSRCARGTGLDRGDPGVLHVFPRYRNLGTGDTITGPLQLSLLSLEETKDHRETTVAKLGLGSASEGNDGKRTIKLNSEKIRPLRLLGQSGCES